MEALLIIVGIVLLIIHICMIVAFFGMSKDLRALKELYVDGEKTISDNRILTPHGTLGVRRYYQLPLGEISAEDRKKDYDEFVKNILDRNKKGSQQTTSVPFTHGHI